MIKNKICYLILFFFLLSALPALGSKEQKAIQVTGYVRLVGSSPLASLVISGENREWYIEREEHSKLVDLQQQAVTVKGTEYYIDLVFANGDPAGRQYYLKNIKIISP